MAPLMRSDPEIFRIAGVQLSPLFHRLGRMFLVRLPHPMAPLEPEAWWSLKLRNVRPLLNLSLAVLLPHVSSPGLSPDAIASPSPDEAVADTYVCLKGYQSGGNLSRTYSG